MALELLAADPDNQVRHYWRDGVALTWSSAGPIGANDAAVCPTLTGTTYNRNFECVYLTTGRRLHHFYFDQSSQKWSDGGVFGPTDAAGVPGFIQGNYGAPGNFEVVVRTADGRLNHWWRVNGPPWTWNDGGRFGSNIALSGASLIQSHFGGQGNLELVAVLNSGQMQHRWRDDDSGNIWKPGLIPLASSNLDAGRRSHARPIHRRYAAQASPKFPPRDWKRAANIVLSTYLVPFSLDICTEPLMRLLGLGDADRQGSDPL